MKSVAIDTNIILRFLLGDSLELHKKAKEIFNRAKKGEYDIFLDEVILAETVWTLTRPHKQSREDIYRKLSTLVSQDWIVNPDKKRLLKALEIYHRMNLSYIDSWLIVVSQDRKIELKTFDKELEKMAG